MWDAFVAWFQSAAGQRVLDDAVIPAVAIIVAGLIAALIARGAVQALLNRADRDSVAGSVAALVEAARVRAGGAADRAEDERIDRLRTEADVRLRLSRPKGAALAADWASLRLDAIERDGSSPVQQSTADADEVRDRLLAWVARPGRAKRLFAEDVARLGAERDARRTKAGTPRSAPPETPSDAAVAPTPAPASPPGPAAPTAPADGQGSDDATGSAAVAARLKTHKGRIENQPEPVSARSQSQQDEPDREPAPAARADAAAAPEADRPPSTEPVLIQRTRLDSLARADAETALERSRHARPSAPATAVPAAVAAEADVEVAPPAEPVAAPEAPAVAVAAAKPAPAAEPADPPAPSDQKQPVPAWLDTYDDEADVTRDIDLSKTPPPMSAAAVRDRTRTGDDIVPRH